MKNKIYDFINNNRNIIITSLICFFISHFIFLTVEAIMPSEVSVDDITFNYIKQTNFNKLIINLLQSLRFEIVNKNIIFFVVCIFNILSTCFIVKIFNINNKLLSLFVAGGMATFPSLCETLMNVHLADIFTLGTFLSIISIYLILRKELKCKIFSCILAIFVIAISTGYIMILLTIIATKVILDLLNKDTNTISYIKHIAINFGLYILSLLGYLLIDYVIRKVTNYNVTSDLIFGNVFNSYNVFFDFFFKNNIVLNGVWNRGFINGIILLITLINLILIIIQNKLYKDILKLTTIIVLIILVPIFCNIINVMFVSQTYGLIFMIQYVIIFVFALKLLELLKNNIYAKCSNILALLCSFALIVTYIYSNNATYMARSQIHNNFYATCSRVLNSVQQIEGYNKNSLLIFAGTIESTPEIANFAISSNCVKPQIEASYEGISKIQDFYKKYMGIDINMADKNSYLEFIITDTFKKMSVYPNNDSIKLLDTDVILIKLEENPPIE